MLKKLTYIIPLIIVTAFGFYLNSRYYQYYFQDAGYPGAMPLLMATFFISSELCLWAFSSNKNAVSISLKYGLVIFSIFVTLSSQYTSTSEKYSDSAVEIYEKIDNSLMIADYRDQVKIQDTRIDQIFRQRENDFMFTMTDESLKFAQSQKSKYEALLKKLLSQDKQEIKKVYEVSNIYQWFSVDLPRIFKSGLNEEFIRVIFQLFSSLILAAMSPVCISLLRAYKPPKQKKPVKPKQAPKPRASKLAVQLEPTEPENLAISEIIPESIIPEPVVIPEPVKLTKTGASNIVIMLLKEDYLKLSPEEVSSGFEKLPDATKHNLHYSPEECKIMQDFIISNKLEDEDKDKIMEVWNNANNR